MNSAFIILFIIIIAGFSGLFWFLSSLKKSDPRASETQNTFLLIQNQINEITRMLDMRLGESARLMQTHSQSNFKIVQDLSERLAERLTRLDETNKQVVGFADQLQSLQDILKNPKQRGILGEFYLETLLKNVLPPDSFKMQYGFKDGTIVDAVIITKDGIIPIDSKFSLENYNRILATNDQAEREKLERLFREDLKARIDETSKYIKPKEGTLDFALMFIPSEAIYYDLLVNQVGAVKINTRSLLEYASKEKHVVIVSPTTFHAYLMTILQGLRSFKVEESAKEIIEHVE